MGFTRWNKRLRPVLEGCRDKSQILETHMQNGTWEVTLRRIYCTRQFELLLRLLLPPRHSPPTQSSQPAESCRRRRHQEYTTESENEIRIREGRIRDQAHDLNMYGRVMGAPRRVVGPTNPAEAAGGVGSWERKTAKRDIESRKETKIWRAGEVGREDEGILAEKYPNGARESRTRERRSAAISPMNS